MANTVERNNSNAIYIDLFTYGYCFVNSDTFADLILVQEE
jgi:hypothetical protein